MASVEVSRAAAEQRRLPLVSVRSGKPGAGYAPAGRKPLVVAVPLTQAEFDRMQLLVRRKASALYGGVVCVVAGVAMARFPVLLPLGVAIALLSAALWAAAWLALRRLLPTVEPGPGDDTVVLRGVHRAFAAAVRERR